MKLDPIRWRDNPRILVSFSAMILLLALWLTWGLPSEADYYNDANVYLSGAASLHSGQGYRMLPYLDSPGISIYPPAYSAWLAAFWGKGFPENTRTLMLSNCLAALLGLGAMLAFLWRVGLPKLLSSLIVILFATSFAFTDLLLYLFSDMLFLGVTAFLWLQLDRAGTAEQRSSYWWLQTGLLLALAYLVKSAALGFIAGLGILWLLDGAWRNWKSSAAFLLPLAGSVLWWRSMQAGIATQGYGVQLKDKFEDLQGPLGYLGTCLSLGLQYLSGNWLVELTLSVPHRLNKLAPQGDLSSLLVTKAPLFIVSISLSVLALIGIYARRHVPNNRGLLMATAFYFLQLCLWPLPIGARGAIVLMPPLALWVVWGWKHLAPRRATVYLAFCFLLINLAGNIYMSSREKAHIGRSSATKLSQLRAAADWLKDACPSPCLVAAYRDIPLMHFYSYWQQPLLASAQPNRPHNGVRDVPPWAQGNRTADYLVHSQEWSHPPDPSYNEVARFGPWVILQKPQR